MPRPSLLQGIFQQPSQPYVVREQAFAQPAAHPRRAVFPLVDGPKGKLTKADSIGRRGWRPPSLDVAVEDVPTLPFDGSASPNTASSSPVSTSPSPTPPPLSPASTPKSSTPSFTDETSDSSTDPEFVTPPDSPKPPAANPPASVDIPCNSPPAVTSQLVRQTLPTPPESLLLSARRPSITPSSSSSSSPGDSRSLFSSSSSDGTASTSRRSSPVSSSTKNASTSGSSTTTRPHGVRQTPLSGVPDWAKDVRWLVGHQPAAKRAALSALTDPNYHPQRPLGGQVRAATAPAGASSRNRDYDQRGTDQFGVYTGLPPRPSGSRRSGSRRIRAVTEGRRSGYRMSALVEVSESEESGDARPDGAPDGLVRKRSTSQQRTRTRPHSIRSSSSTSSSRTVLATPLPVSSGETIPGAGYASLTLPRTGYTPSKTPDRPTSTIDLAKNGLAQTSMSAISIIRSNASTRSRRTSLSLSLNSSRSSLSAMSSRNTSMSSLGSRSMLGLGMGSASIPLAVRLAEIDGALGLTAHSPPSRKVGSSQVLVQVHAVALDSLDALIISQRLAKGGYGFIPGRSFVGRAIECGFEVANVGRGDWVIGLTDIRKCGALSEFIVIDRGRVCAIPRPTDRLTTTQCALLPLSAVPAHRAVRTIPYSAVKYGPRGERRPMRVLVLQAHDGAGLLAVQEMRGLGMRVTAQVPVGAENVGFGFGPTLRPRERGRTRAGKGREVDPGHGRNLEAVEVVIGDDPIEVISRLEEGVYDAVIDTVGGRAVWDACRRVMCSEAHFTTLVGDSFDTVPSMNAHVRSSFRSLARAFTKQSKAIGYQWVSPAADLDHEGEDIRHSLTAVADAAALAAYGSPQRSSVIGEESVKVSAGMLPRVTCSFPLERASDAFAVDEDGRGPLVRGGTVVVRVL